MCFRPALQQTSYSCALHKRRHSLPTASLVRLSERCSHKDAKIRASISNASNRLIRWAGLYLDILAGGRDVNGSRNIRKVCSIVCGPYESGPCQQFWLRLDISSHFSLGVVM